TDNILVGPGDYDTYCITAPSDARLPGGGGYPICGLANIKQDKFGQSLQVIQPTSMFGTNVRTNDFYSIGIDARLGRGARLGGGFDTGRSVNDNCYVVDSPTSTANTIDGEHTCRVVTPFKGQTQVKLNGSFPLRAGFVVSGVFQDMSGPAISATYAAPNALIAPS